jgi:hypothetical protein
VRYFRIDGLRKQNLTLYPIICEATSPWPKSRPRGYCQTRLKLWTVWFASSCCCCFALARCTISIASMSRILSDSIACAFSSARLVICATCCATQRSPLALALALSQSSAATLLSCPSLGSFYRLLLRSFRLFCCILPHVRDSLVLSGPTRTHVVRWV